VREELEGLACQLFATGATDEQRAALHRAFANLKKTYKSSDPLPRLQAKNQFYDCLFDGSRNEALGISLRMLNSRIMLLRAMSLQAKGRSQTSIAELTEIMDALDARDPKRARKAAVTHVREAADAAIALMAAPKGAAPTA
jgi:DNA-binding GntR family transcriptional regulator